MVKIGLVGLGHLGKIHLKLLSEIEGYDIAGIFDIDTQLTSDLAKQYKVKACENYEELLNLCEAVDIVTPSLTHFELASYAIKKHKHVFIEKPITPTAAKAFQLQQLNMVSKKVIQAGHVERFNPAFISSIPYLDKPQKIDFKRFAIYNPRGTDVSVTLDLMVHDLDILLSLVKSKIKSLDANGHKTVSESPDVAEAVIEFENGCTALLSTNRNASGNRREITVFQEDKVIFIDLLNKKTSVFELINYSGKVVDLDFEKLTHLTEKNVLIKYADILPTNAIKEELMAFHNSITTGQKPAVTIEDAINVLNLVQEIDKKILNPSVK